MEAAREPSILLIEDDMLIGTLIEDVLGNDGFEITWHTNGSEGLAAAQELRPDLVLLDLMLPEVDGWTVLNRLKTDPATAGSKVILVSAVIDRSTDGERALADAVLRKPFRIEQLLEVVYQALGTPVGGPPADSSA